MSKGLIGCGIIIAVFVFISICTGGFVIGNYNSLKVSNNKCSFYESEIDNQLDRKAKLIPNLVASVKGYAKHESQIMSNIAESRSKLLNAKTVVEKVEANDGLSSALGRLMMLTENYPNLKADKNFTALQDQLEGTENRIAVARRDYNLSVNALNNKIDTFPSSLFVGMAGVNKRQLFETSGDIRSNNTKVEF